MNLFKLALYLMLFTGYAIWQHFGWNIDNSSIPVVIRFSPFLLLLILITIRNYLSGKFKVNVQKEERSLLITFCVLVPFCMISNRYFALFNFVKCFFPILTLSLCISVYNTDESRHYFRKVVDFFFVILCSMAVIEKILGYCFFPVVYEESMNEIVDIDYGFRSTSLHGHPLNNALLVIIYLSFLFISKFHTEKRKLCLYGLGAVSLLCFNTRSSIVFVSLMISYYIFSNFWSVKRSLSIKLLYIVFIITGIYGSFFLFQHGFGDRLIEDGLSAEEGSISARIAILNVLDHFSSLNWLFGMDRDAYFRLVSYYVHGGHAENYWINFIFYYGLIFLFFIVVSIIRICKKYLLGLKFKDLLVVILPFLIISSTNNSLSTSDIPLAFYVLCAWLYNINNYIRTV